MTMPLVPEWGDFDQVEGEFGDMDPVNAYYAGRIPWDDLDDDQKRKVADGERKARETSDIHYAKYRNPAKARHLEDVD